MRLKVTKKAYGGTVYDLIGTKSKRKRKVKK